MDMESLTIDSVAARFGLKIPNSDLFHVVSNATELFLIHILEDAIVLSSVDHRPRLSIRDINESLRINKLSPLYGYSSSHPLKIRHFSHLPGEDLVVYQNPRRPISSFTHVSDCRYQYKPTFDLIWLISNHQIISQNQLPLRSPSPDSDEIQINWRNTSPKLCSYFDQTINLLHRGGIEFERALSCMARSNGIGELLPRYLEFIIESIKRPSTTSGFLYSLVKLTRAIVANNHLNIVESVDKIVSIVLTILFLQNNSMGSLFGEEIAELVQSLCDKFESVLVHLRGQIAKELLTGMLEEDCNEVSFYGGLCCFLSLGIEAVSRIFLPMLKKIERKVRELKSVLVADGLKKVLGMSVFRERWAIAMYGHLPSESCALANHRVIADFLGIAIAEFDLDEHSLLMI